jgi:N-carbamoyl-L-amino-acid hydrolase
VKFTVDIRSLQDAIVNSAKASIESLLERICVIEGTTHTLQEIWRAKRVYFDGKVVDMIQRETKTLGFSWSKMLSWAGHDAQMMAKVTPTGMIFIPCKNGRTHCEEEHASNEDIVRGTQVLVNTVSALDAA